MYWTAHIKGGPKRVNHAAAAVGDYIFMFGGYCTGDTLSYKEKHPIDTHILNTNTLQWYQLKTLINQPEDLDDTPYHRYGHTAVSYGTDIFLWGGRNDESACNRLFRFDTVALKWSCPRVSGCVPCPRDGHSACIIRDHMYIFGGFEEQFDRYSQEVYALDLKNMHWSFISTSGTPPVYRDFHSATALGNNMYIYGGRSDQEGSDHIERDYYPNDIMYLDTLKMEWHKPDLKGYKPVGRRSHSAFVYQDELFIFGGYNATINHHFNDLYRFCPSNNTWYPVLTAGRPPKRRRRQVCIVIKDKMYLFGGTSPTSYKITQDDMNLMDIQDIKLMDHDDLHVLDLSPTLKTLSMLAVMHHNLDTDPLPLDVKLEMNMIKCNNWTSFPSYYEDEEVPMEQ